MSNLNRPLTKREERRAEKVAKLEQEARFIALEQKHNFYALVNQRTMTLKYLHDIHDDMTLIESGSGNLWVNSVSISEVDLKRHSLKEIPASRILSFYY